MAGWVKLDKGILHSTVWREPDHVRLVWLAMLIMAESDGVVTASLPGLADSARVPIDKCKDALDRLSAPDEYSRTPDNEGRRIKRVDDGWLLLNYDAYRKTDRTATERQRRHRAKLNREDVTRDNRDTGVTGRDGALHGVTGRDVTEPLSSCVRSPEGGVSTGASTGGSGGARSAGGSTSTESGQQQGGSSTTPGGQPQHGAGQSVGGGGQHGGGTATPPPTSSSSNRARTRSGQQELVDTIPREAYDCADVLRTLVLHRNRDHTAGGKRWNSMRKQWASALLQLHSDTGADWERIDEVMHWTLDRDVDRFWWSRVTSGALLARHWDAITAQMANPWTPGRREPQYEPPKLIERE
jgi:hypothetical protein